MTSFFAYLQEFFRSSGAWFRGPVCYSYVNLSSRPRTVVG